MVVSFKTYEQLVLEDSDRHWELHRGRLVEKPSMTWEHNITARNLAADLTAQLDRRIYDVACNIGRVSRPEESFYIPDVYVIPREMQRRLRRPRGMEAYPEPLPLVVEVWSPSTGDYDVDSKLPEYQARGDLEIWRIHPYERTLIAWRRQPDGSYTETTFTEGSIQPIGLPDVSIELASLFEWD
jgi:Uma2 family endonuclease